MEKCLSIVLSSDAKNYRKVAQVHWGLTDAQMKGKHVHHHPAVSEGGRNVPEHLYVCSPSMHAHGWHNGEYFIEQATVAGVEFGSKGGAVGGKCPWWTRDGKDVRSWNCPGEGWTNGRSLMKEVGSLPYWTNGKENVRRKESPGPGWTQGLSEVWWTDGVKDVKASVCPGEGWSRGRPNAVTNSQKWKCLVTGTVSTAGPLSRFQKARGIDTSLRVKVG